MAGRDVVQAGAEGFELGSGSVGVLLVHGYSSSPQTLRGMGEHLAREGVRVVTPLLPGHGTTVADLARRHPEEWVQTVEDAYSALAEQSERVVVVGSSFGAALAIDLAARTPDISALALLASVVQFPATKRSALWLIRWFVPTVPGVRNDISDPALRTEIGYDRLPTKATYRMMRYLTGMPDRLRAVRCPVLILHGRQDHVAPASSPLLVHRLVASERKELVWLERSSHVITLDVEREEVFRRVDQFIRASADES